MIPRAIFLIVIVVLLLAIRSEHAPLTAQTPLLVQADYQRCVTVVPPPLLTSPRGPYDYRIGQPFNDKGSV